MKKTVFSKDTSAGIVGVLSRERGGSGQTTASAVLDNMLGLPVNQLGLANGAAVLDERAKLGSDIIPNEMIAISINGPRVLDLNVTVTGEYTITDYDPRKTYTLVALGGSVSRVGATITYTAPSSVGSHGFTINSRIFGVTVVDTISTVSPVIISPYNTSNNLGPVIVAVSSPFQVSSGSDTHEMSDWQISSTSDFSVIVSSTANDATNKTSWTSGALPINSTLYMRVRHKGVTRGWSTWSRTTVFSTKKAYYPSGQSAVFYNVNQAETDSVYISEDGSTAAVSSMSTTAGSPSGAGGVNIFVKSNTGVWSHQSFIRANDATAEDKLGSKVVLSSDGNILAVSAPGATVSGAANTGAIYVFRRTGSIWAQEAKITLGAIGETVTNFPSDFDMSSDGTRIVAGYHRENDNTGRAYVFTEAANVWTQWITRQGSDVTIGDEYGYSVAISRSGTRIYIGAPNKINTQPSGAFYVHHLNESLNYKVQSPYDIANYRFGDSIFRTSSTTTILAGARGTESERARAYIYSFTTQWQIDASFIPTVTYNTDANSDYSKYMTMSADRQTLFVSAPKERVLRNNGSDAGAVYIYTKDNSQWSLKTKLHDSLQGSNEFGNSLAISDDSVSLLIGVKQGFMFSASAVIFS